MIPGIAAGQMRIASGSLPTVIGQAYGGGYYAGAIAYGGKNYKIIIAPSAADTLGIQWKTVDTETTGTDSTDDGMANSVAMDNAAHPAAQYCLSYVSDGFADWYMPATAELNLFWLNLSPVNPATPAAFRTGGGQALSETEFYLASTQYNLNKTLAWRQRFNDGLQSNTNKTSTTRRTRPIRRIEF